jgi:hypothetical protein
MLPVLLSRKIGAHLWPTKLNVSGDQKENQIAFSFFEVEPFCNHVSFYFVLPEIKQRK